MTTETDRSAAAPEIAPKRRDLFHTTEGVVLIVGLTLAVSWIAAILVLLQQAPETGQALLGMSVANLFFGRMAGVSLGFASPLSSGLVVFANGFIETILVLLVYPLFVLSWRRMLRFRVFARYLVGIRQAAEHYQPYIERYGPAGLFVFVWIPFWMTGPVVGAAIGWILGLKLRVTFSVVFGGTWIAVYCWARLLKPLQHWLADFGPYVPAGFVVVLILVVCLARWLHLPYQKKQRPKE